MFTRDVVFHVENSKTYPKLAKIKRIYQRSTTQKSIHKDNLFLLETNHEQTKKEMNTTTLLPAVSQRQNHSGIKSTSPQAENCATALTEIKMIMKTEVVRLIIKKLY